MKTARKQGMSVGAGVEARPKATMRVKRASQYAVWAYNPVPLQKVVEAVGKAKAALLRTVERDGEPHVPLAEIARKLGRAMVEQLRPMPAWMETFHNNVVHEGLDHSLNQHLKGSSYTAAWYIGLTDGTPTVADTDTISSHAGWTEVTAYDEAKRQTLTLGAVSGQSVDNSASKGTFSINSSTTVGGAFVISGDGGTAKGGSTNGTLYGGGAFTGGDRSLGNGDTLNVQITFTAGTA